MEKVGGNGDEGSGGGGGVFREDDAGFDGYVEGFNQANRGEAGSHEVESGRPEPKVVSKPGSTWSNPIHSKTGGL